MDEEQIQQIKFELESKSTQELENLVKTAEWFPSLVISTIIMPDKELTPKEKKQRETYLKSFVSEKKILEEQQKKEFKKLYQTELIPQKNNVSEFSTIPNPDIRNNIIGIIIFISLLYVYYLPLSYFNIL
jgi:hypothetical protein